MSSRRGEQDRQIAPARRPIVGVIGSGSEEHADRAAPLGAWLAGQGVHLLTGGGGGVMASVCRAFAAVADRAGHTIGILPGVKSDTGYGPPPGYPNPWVEIPVHTHLGLSGRHGRDPLSRNHINILSSEVIIALPGSHGTANEVALALGYGRPLIAWLASRTEIDGLPEAALVEPDLDQVKNFVLSRIRINLIRP